MKNMNGNNPAGAQAESRLRLLLTYKGSAYAGEDIQDDYIFLSLVHDGSPDPLASAVINFPVIDGKRVLFIHDIQPHGEKKSLMESIESIASGTAITKRANDAGISAAHAGEVYEAAKAGNETAKEIMEDTYEYLSNFLGTLYGVLDPEIFILSGSVALKIPGFIKEVEKRTKEKVYDALKENVKIIPAALGEDCGLIGAACLILHDPS